MKLKGINPIERNIEKIVLGVVFALLLGALAMQFLVQPNRVDVGGSRTVPPQDIYTELASEAQTLKGQIEDQDPRLPTVPETDLQARFDAGRSGNPSGVDRLANIMPPARDVMGGLEIDAAGPESLDGPVMAARAPAPTDAVAYAQWGTVDPFKLAATESLSTFVPASQPHDLASVSVEGVFSGTELAALLSSSDEGLRAIPGTWRRSVEVVGVALERQRLLPDGSWGQSEAATPAPGSADLLDELTAEDVDLSTVLRVAGDAGRDRESVVQPRATGIIAGPVWEAPSRALEIQAAMSEPGSLPRLQVELARAEQNLDELEERKAAQSGTPRPQRNFGGAGGEGGEGGGERGGSSGSRPSSNRPGRTTGIDRRIEDAREAVDELNQRIDEAERELETQREASSDSLNLPLFEQESLRIWGHDIGVRPGETYRYRLRAVVNNPLYKKGSQLDESDEQQQSLAREALVYGAWSDWTDPVSVGDRTYYFVTNATRDSRLSRSGAQATVEVFHMYYGHYRSDRVILEPGDAVRVQVGVPEGFVLFDEETLDEDGMRRYITNQTPPGEETPEGVTWAPTELDVGVPAFLLDVSDLPLTRANALGEPEMIRQVVIRTPDGRLEVRRPSDEVEAPGYAAAESSAIAGQIVDLRLPDEERPGRRPGRGASPFGGEFGGGEGGSEREGP